MIKPHLYIAIPAMDENDYLPACLDALKKQKTDFAFSVYICVNQPESWWSIPEKRAVCERNAELIALLKEIDVLDLYVMDRSSQGQGWQGKKQGVGWARKVLFDTICVVANEEDVIISLDADTLFSAHYLQSIGENFTQHDDLPVLAVPYYHPLANQNQWDTLSGVKPMMASLQNEELNRALLRYEIYLRNWHLNMAQIGSPYTFTALGSAIAMRVWALQKVGGITPFQSGEDFYLLQKLRKMTPLNQWNSEAVFPSGRSSQRVVFGTGKAVIQGISQQQLSYPIFHHSIFNKIMEAYHLLPKLFEKDIESTFFSFLKKQLNDSNIWSPLRKNFKTQERFERAFHEKADGLRIFQFVRQESLTMNMPEEQILEKNINYWLKDSGQPTPHELFNIETPLASLPIEKLNKIRNLLWDLESKVRKQCY
ncbi:MAG: hypothetical protein LBU51_07480 [Bacteroidales bacterium]|jgi:hypothetical protein|nr:hypothetical protein [Bacteroidales bacterium]